MGRQPYLRFFNVIVKLPTFNFHLCFNMQFDNMHVLTLELSPLGRTKVPWGGLSTLLREC